MIDLIKKALLIVIVAVVGYYGLRFWSGYSLAKQFQECAIELNSGGRLQAAKTDAERVEIQLSVHECVAKRVRFPGTLGFNEKAFRESASKP